MNFMNFVTLAPLEAGREASRIPGRGKGGIAGFEGICGFAAHARASGGEGDIAMRGEGDDEGDNPGIGPFVGSPRAARILSGKREGAVRHPTA